MIQETKIDRIDQIFDLMTEHEYREDLDRYRSLYAYRGMTDVNFHLQTSLARNCKGRKEQLESAILNSFTKYAALDEPTLEDSVWTQMILGQHHGLPTRLLDWSHSALVALHFATAEADLDEMDQHDSVVWRIDIDELHQLVPEKYKRIERQEGTTVFSVSMLKRACNSIREYDRDMRDRAMLVIEPPSIDPRIVNQYSFFSIVPNEMDDIEQFLDTCTNHTIKYVIDRKLRWHLRDILDQQNINERMIYPGLDGICKALTRHYFVK